MIDEGCLDQTILKPSVAFLRIGQCLSCWDLESIWCFIVSVGANCNQGNLKRIPTSATKGAKKNKGCCFSAVMPFDLLPFYSTKIKRNEKLPLGHPHIERNSGFNVRPCSGWCWKMSTSERTKTFLESSPAEVASMCCNMSGRFHLLMVEPTPLKNMSSSVGMIIPNIWQHKTCSKAPTSQISSSSQDLLVPTPVLVCWQAFRFSEWVHNPNETSWHNAMYQSIKNHSNRLSFRDRLYPLYEVISPVPYWWQYIFLCWQLAQKLWAFNWRVKHALSLALPKKTILFKIISMYLVSFGFTFTVYQNILPDNPIHRKRMLDPPTKC